LYKWHEQVVMYNEFAGSKIRSEIQSMRYEIKYNRKTHTQRKRHNTSKYHNYNLFIKSQELCIKFQLELRLYTIAVVFSKLPTNPVYIKTIPLYRNLVSPLDIRVELLSPGIMDLFSLKENNNFNGFTKNRKLDFTKS